MSDPVLVACLVALRTEFNRKYPARDKGADGWIGDKAHQQESSDHNPDESGRTPYEDADDINEVHALDVDANVKPGTAGPAALLADVEHIRLEHKAGRDDRLQNIIYRGKIASRSWGWTWDDYDGASQHFDHAHFSARYDTSRESDVSPWGVLPVATDITPSDANANAILGRSVVPKDGGAAGEKVTAIEALRQAQVTKARITELTVGPGRDGDPRSIYDRLTDLETQNATQAATLANLWAIVAKLDGDPAEGPDANLIVKYTRYAIAHPS